MKNFKFISSIVLATTLTSGMTTAQANINSFDCFTISLVACIDLPKTPIERTWKLDRLQGTTGIPIDRSILTSVDAIALSLGNTTGEEELHKIILPIRERSKTPPFVPSEAQSNKGNFCSTPAGRFGPGPVDYLGNNCWAHGPYGVVYGFVSR